MDSLGALNAFVQAAEARSFTIAGRQLGVSSSAIGKAVARMEERLGVRLFHRSTRRHPNRGGGPIPRTLPAHLF
jgi:DNA-binding transcriptional LysR family regulator